MAKKIAILGSTGSIGTSALRVIEGLGGGYDVVALSAHSNVRLLAEQVRRFGVRHVAITNADFADDLAKELADEDVEIVSGSDGMVKIAELDEVDTLITAVVGAAGLAAVLRAAAKGKTLAIANKEPLVIAGEMLTRTARENGATIIPVDSEHSAIFQAMQAGSVEEVRRIILTASGGPFRKSTRKELENVTLEDALAHPTWNMGPKITIDSATMMNKALEIIEAVWLFGVEVDKIDILIHPESVVHSMVEFVDGSVIAQLGTPDMCVPIQYALTYPKRLSGIAKRIKFEELGSLTFEKPNMEAFRSLKLGFAVARAGGSAPVVFNASNEAAVEAFLAGKIKFNAIMELVERCVDEHEVSPSVTLEELLEADAWARRKVCEYLVKNTVSF